MRGKPPIANVSAPAANAFAITWRPWRLLEYAHQAARDDAAAQPGSIGESAERRLLALASGLRAAGTDDGGPRRPGKSCRRPSRRGTAPPPHGAHRAANPGQVTAPSLLTKGSAGAHGRRGGERRPISLRPARRGTAAGRHPTSARWHEMVMTPTAAAGRYLDQASTQRAARRLMERTHR